MRLTELKSIKENYVSMRGEQKIGLRRETLTKTLTDPFELKYLDRRNYEGVAPEIAAQELDK